MNKIKVLLFSLFIIFSSFISSEEVFQQFSNLDKFVATTGVENVDQSQITTDSPVEITIIKYRKLRRGNTSQNFSIQTEIESLNNEHSINSIAQLNFEVTTCSLLPKETSFLHRYQLF